VDRSLAESGFEKTLRIETRLTKNMLATSCKLKNIFRKRIEKRLLDSRFRIQFQKASDFSFLTKSLKLSEEKTIQSTWLALSRKASKIIYPGNSLLTSILIFSAFARQQTVLWSFSASCCWIFVLQKSIVGFGKRAILTARQRSLDFRQLRKSTWKRQSASRHYGNFESVPKFWQQTHDPWRLPVKSTIP